MTALFSERFSVFTGCYGSGKTELSIAIARHVRKKKTGRVALVDLDIVNPYFRSAEKEALLLSEGIEVFMPSFAMSTVDIPALPAQIMAVFEQPFSHVVIDVGGHDTGAAALGRYAPHIARVRHELRAYGVVNACRPFSDTPQGVAEMFELIATRGRVRPDALVNNTNLQGQTTAQLVAEGYALTAEAARLMGVPVAFSSGTPATQAQLPPDVPYFAFEPVMLPEFLGGKP